MAKRSLEPTTKDTPLPSHLREQLSGSRIIADCMCERARIRNVVDRFEALRQSSRDFYRRFGLAADLAAAGVAIIARPANIEAQDGAQLSALFEKA